MSAGFLGGLSYGVAAWAPAVGGIGDYDLSLISVAAYR